MAHQIVKISVHALTLGMYVDKLDRPWIESDFLIQGFLVRSQSDLNEICATCNYVYVDLDRGRTPPASEWINNDDMDPKQIREGELSKVQNEFKSLRKFTYQSVTPIDLEMDVAKKSFDEVQKSYQVLITDLQNGKNLDINSVKSGIEVMVSSILRNPTAFMLVNQLKREDEHSYAHALGCSVWCASFGRHLGLERQDIDSLALGGMLLDVGKSKLPKALLQKNGALTPDEQQIMRTHVDRGVKLLIGNNAIPHEAFRMVASHHERHDGSGYPLQLEGDDIPIFGRIAGLVDSYDAMTTKSYYRKEALSPHAAINELNRLKGSAFQIELVEQFIQTVGLYPTGSLIELTTGEVAVIVEVNALRRLHPTVMVLLDADKKPYKNFKMIDLADKKIDVKQSLPSNAFGIKMDELFL
ncbi:MAG: HD-GYP domain-containing protein [Gammaproteobacteria bacterium]|nr:HD-GYP domain-containing protein [Gammaproteobacteria bacterium]